MQLTSANRLVVMVAIGTFGLHPAEIAAGLWRVTDGTDRLQISIT